MPYKGELQQGSTVEIGFEAGQGNSSHSTIHSQTIPQIAPPGLAIVSPGFVGVIKYEELPLANQLQIHLYVPEPEGKGILTVVENGKVKDSEQIENDAIWVYAIAL